MKQAFGLEISHTKKGVKATIPSLLLVRNDISFSVFRMFPTALFYLFTEIFQLNCQEKMRWNYLS